MRFGISFQNAIVTVFARPLWCARNFAKQIRSPFFDWVNPCDCSGPRYVTIGKLNVAFVEGKGCAKTYASAPGHVKFGTPPLRHVEKHTLNEFSKCFCGPLSMYSVISGRIVIMDHVFGQQNANILHKPSENSMRAWDYPVNHFL